MCSIVVPGMKARKRGAIVNVGSGSATFLPSYPLYAVYGATKVIRSAQIAMCRSYLAHTEPRTARVSVLFCLC